MTASRIRASSSAAFAVFAAVLRGLGERPDDRIYGAAFLNAVGLANAGAVRKAVQRLEANGLVYEHEGSHRPRFLRFLESNRDLCREVPP